MDYSEIEMDESLTANQSLNDSRAQGLKCSYHGTVFQINLSMYYHQIATKSAIKYSLQNEDGIPKFDDINIIVEDKLHYGIQCKHVMMNSISKNITYGMLCSPNQTQFSLLHYFIQYKNYTKNDMEKGKQRTMIVCTNNDFKKKKEEEKKKKKTKKEEEAFLEEIQFEDGFLNKIEGAKFRKILFQEDSDLVTSLKNASDVARLAKELCNKSHLDLRSPILKTYWVPLMNEILTCTNNNKKIQKNTEYKYRDDFEVTNDVKKKALRDEINRIKQHDLRKTKKFTVSSTLRKHPKLSTEQLVNATEVCCKTSLPNDIIDNQQIKDFLDRLVFAVNLPNEEKLSEIIKKNILNVSDYSKNEINKDQVDFIFSFVQWKMSDFFKNPKSPPIKKNDDYFKEGGKKVSNIMSCIPHIEYTRDFTKLKLEFKVERLKKITDFLSPDETKNILIIKTTDKDLLLTKAKVYQVKQEVPWPFEVLLLMKERGICLHNLYINDTLVIVSDKKVNNEFDKYVPSFIEELNEYVKNKKVIFISSTDDTFYKNFRQNFSILIDETTLKDLSKPLLRSLLKKEIKFQGEDTSFASVLLGIDNNRTLKDEILDDLLNKLKEVLEPGALSEIILNENISVWDSFNDKNSLYNDFFSYEKFKIRKSGTEEYEEDIRKINGSAWIIAGDAGIGKSAFLTKYSQELSSSSWIIRINLKKHDDGLKENSFANNNDVVKFLIENIATKEQHNSVTKCILTYRLTYGGKIIFFLDGYNEVSNKSQENVINFVKHIKKTKGQVCITTRTKELKDLEKYAEISSESSYILEYSDDRKEKEIIKEYVASENVNINEPYDVYTSFIKLQYELYFKKEGINNLKELLSKKFTKEYMFVAMETLFGYNEVIKLLSSMKLNRKKSLLNDCLYNIPGIIRINEKGVTKFIYPGCAKFFVAKFLIYALGKCKDISDLVKEENILSTIMADHEICTFVTQEIDIINDDNLKKKWQLLRREE